MCSVNEDLVEHRQEIVAVCVKIVNCCFFFSFVFIRIHEWIEPCFSCIFCIVFVLFCGECIVLSRVATGNTISFFFFLFFFLSHVYSVKYHYTYKHLFLYFDTC